MATIPKAVRYWSVGLTQVHFLPAIADPGMAPTREEIVAGTDLTGEIAEWDGWSTTSEKIDTPDMVSRFVSNIPGAISAEDSSLTFYADRAGDDVRLVLPRDTSGFIIWMDGGDVPENYMDVYPVTVASAPKIRSTDNATMIRVDFNITSEPAEDQVIPQASGGNGEAA